MTKRQTLSLLGALLLAPIYLYFLSEFNTNAQTCCSNVPTRPTAVPRYPQNTAVTVYIDTTGLNTPSGFSDLEKQAIKDGIEDWNSQANNSGVTFTVQETTNPPTLPAQANVVVVQYQNQQNSGAIADTQTFSSGPYVSNRIVFYQNIRNVWDIPQNQPPFVRSVARHETGHVLGLGDADDCPPGSTIMRLAESGEQFITECDNTAVNSQTALYPSPTPTPVPSPSSTPCAQENQSCTFASDCCPGLTCGELTYRCIPCQSDPHEYKNGCMSEACANCYLFGGTYCDPVSGNCWTPILVDVEGNGLDMTGLEDGISFDAFGHDTEIRTSWTRAGSDDAWLVLDRNGNGIVDNGTELFSSAAPQPMPRLPEVRNGFNALVEYDHGYNLGNEDGVIDHNDLVFSSLQLWQDKNHNGISEPSELHSLSALGLAAISLDYKEARRKDRFGNSYRYRAKVMDDRGTQLGRWAWDVFPLAHP